jgi:thiol:disulfide interchange protein DsbD
MAAPYALLTSNPALLRYVPKPGAWMKTFKHLMGFLLLATVVFVLVSVRQDLVLFAVTFLIFVALACWWWGHFATFDQTLGKRLATLGLALLIVVVGARFSFVELRHALQGDAETSELDWEEFDPVKLADYHERGIPVMLDFTANWCLTCKTNEQFVYESDEVVELLRQKDVVPMKADMTHDSPRTDAVKRLRTKLGAESIPFMCIFPGRDWRRPFTFKDLVSKDEVLEALRSLE